MENTHIGWTDHTFNPWIGCTKVSPGCANCYAETLMDHRYHKVKWGPEGERVRTGEPYWELARKWNNDRWLQCPECQARGSVRSCPTNKDGRFECSNCGSISLETTRQRVFCASLADVFEDKPELKLWRTDLYRLIRETTNLDWLILTKRPENILKMWPTGVHEFQNVWFGTSVENEKTATERISHLMKVPARVRFLSVEPMLGPVGISQAVYPAQCTNCNGDPFYKLCDDGRWRCPRCGDGGKPEDGPIQWVICGGESGPDCREMRIEWAEDLFKQCRDAGTPFFMKQMGGHPHKRDRMQDFPSHLRVQEFPRC